MDNEDSFSYSPEAIPPVPSPPITVNQPIHDLEDKINEQIQKGDPINETLLQLSKERRTIENQDITRILNQEALRKDIRRTYEHIGISHRKPSLKHSQEFQVIFNTIPEVETVSKRKKKQMARILSHTNTPFTPLEQAVMNRNEEIKDHISECSYEIDKVYDFQILGDEPTVSLAWKDSKQHLAFTKFNFEANHRHFIEKGNGGNYKKMLKFIDEINIQYGTCEDIYARHKLYTYSRTLARRYNTISVTHPLYF